MCHKPDCGKHAVLINVSPMEFGHILLVPNLEDNLPQILTEEALKLSVELILLSNTSYVYLSFAIIVTFFHFVCSMLKIIHYSLLQIFSIRFQQLRRLCFCKSLTSSWILFATLYVS